MVQFKNEFSLKLIYEGFPNIMFKMMYVKDVKMFIFGMMEGCQISETNENQMLRGQNTLQRFSRSKFLPDPLLF